MKALSGYAEWFWLMAKNWKDVENRSWALPLNIREELPIRIYLHASKTATKTGEMEFIIRNLDIPQLLEFRAVNWQWYRGCLIGEITITKMIHRSKEPQPLWGGGSSVGDQQRELEILRRDCPEYFSKWFFGEFGFVVKDGVLYKKPIPYKGRLGFFEVVTQGSS